MRNDASTHSADIHDALQTESLSKAAWMLSCSSSRISFAKSNRGIQNERLFLAEQFRCTLRSKLGAGPIENTPHTEFTCQCNAVYCPRDDPFHGCNCNIKASFRMRHHNEIQWALRDYTKKCLGSAENSLSFWIPQFNLAKLIPDEEQLSIHAALLSDSVWRAS